jgi:hypothetical protein
MANGNLPDGWLVTTLGEVTEINVRDVEIRSLPDNLLITFVPMAAVDEQIGIIAEPQLRPLKEVRKGFTPFSNGDVLFAKITPSMENGKAAIAHNLQNDRGFGSTEFHVLRPKGGVTAEWIFHFIRQESFRKEAKAHFAGTAGQLRVPAGFLVDFPLPLAPLLEQKRIVAKIEQLFTQLYAGTIALNRAQIGLERYKSAVLKAAVEGRLVKQNVEEQSAKELLEKLAEQRKQRILGERLQSFRLYIDLRIQNAGVDYAPTDVFRDFLIETVLENTDIHAAQAVMNEYFRSVHATIDNRVGTQNYISWLANACGALRQLGHESRVLNANLLVWQKYADEGLATQNSNRVIKLKKGAGDSIITGFEKWLEAEKIRGSGVVDFREKYLDEPIEIEWKKEMARLKTPQTKNLPELPTGWCWTTIEQLAKDEKYALAIGPFGSNLKVSDYRETGVPLIFVRHIRSGDFSNTHYVAEEKAEELNAHKVSAGDILITKMGEPPGDAFLYPESSPDAIITADCIKWRLFPILEKRFFVHLINSPFMRRQIQQITRGVAQKKVSLDRFRSLVIPLPPLKEQWRIVEEIDRRLSLAGAVESTLITINVRAERLRQSILRQAFEGRLVPQDSQDEPASKLLERILQNKKDEVAVKPRLMRTERRVRPQKQIPLPLPSSESLKLHEILRTSGRVLSPTELFAMANCKPEDVSRFYQELRHEIYDLKRIIELRPDRTKEGTLEARQ